MSVLETAARIADADELERVEEAYGPEARREVGLKRVLKEARHVREEVEAGYLLEPVDGQDNSTNLYSEGFRSVPAFPVCEVVLHDYYGS